MKTVIHSLNYVPEKGESNTRPSLTVPDMTLSIKDILLNHTRGRALPILAQEPVYNGDVLIPNPKKMDMTDVDEMRRSIREQNDEIKKTANEEIKAKRRKEPEQVPEAEAKQP